MTKKEFNGFHQYSRSWWGKRSIQLDEIVDEVLIHLGESTEGGCRCEFSIRWTMLGGKLASQVRVYDDAWDVFVELPELFKFLATHSTSWPERKGQSTVTADELCAQLLKLGFVDLTEEVEGQGPVGQRPKEMG